MNIIEKLLQIQQNILDEITNLFKIPIFLPILLILFLFVFGFVFKIIYTQKKYGTKHFIKHHEQVSVGSFLSLYIKEIKGIKKTIVLSDRCILMISEYGVYLFLLCTEIGFLEGGYLDQTLIRKSDKMPIYNPFVQLNEFQKKLPHLQNIFFQKVLVIREECNLGVSNYKEEIIVKEKDLVDKIEKNMGVNKKYNLETIQSLYQQYSVK